MTGIRPYSVNLVCDRPQTLSRWLWLFKWIMLIPHFIILYFFGWISIPLMFLNWIIVVIVGVRPKVLFDFFVGLFRWQTRVNIYLAHLTDSYPPFSMQSASNYPVEINVEYTRKANRITSFFRLLMLIPHWILICPLAFLAFGAIIFHMIFVILMGKPHAEVFNLIVSLSRWYLRVNMYFSLATDRYPPILKFS